MIHIVLVSDSGDSDVLHLEITMTIVEVSKFADTCISLRGQIAFSWDYDAM